MAELPLLPILKPLQATDVQGLIAEIQNNFNALQLFFERLRQSIPLKVSVNGTPIAAVRDVNLVAGAGVTLLPVYDTATALLTITITSP